MPVDGTGTITVKLAGTPTSEFPWWALGIAAGIAIVGGYVVLKRR